MTPREVHWIVGAGDPLDLEQLLRRMDQAEDAVTEGRVFIDGRRVTGSCRLREGQKVVVRSGREFAAAPIRVLGRCAGLLAVDKPAGLPTEPDASGLTSLREQLQDELGVSAHALSRLDVGVSGVVLFAETRAARRYMETSEARARYERRYLGIARGTLSGAAQWSSPVGGKQARTRASPVANTPKACLLLLEPLTGRTHQLRVHAAAAGLPLIGDRRHGGTTRLTSVNGAVREVGRIALHAVEIELAASDGQLFRARAALPPDFRQCWLDLDGQASALLPFEAARQ